MTSCPIAANCGATNHIISSSSNPYLKINPTDPAYTTLNDTRAFVLPPSFRIVVPQSSRKLVEIARRACGLIVRAEAEKVPHVHYPFNNIISIDNNIKSNNNERSNHNDSIKAKLESNSPEFNSETGSTSEGTFIKQESPSQASYFQLLHSLNRIRDKRNHRRHRTHPSSPITDPNNTHTRGVCTDIVDGNKSPPRLEARTLDNSQPTLVLGFRYKKGFLAGPPEKTNARDRRVFYQRTYVCRRV